MGPTTGMAQLPAARLPFGKSIVVPGLLNWVSTIGWDGINSLFGAFALTLLIPGLPFVVALLIIVICQGALGIFGYEAIHTFEKWGAVVLGIMFAILTVAILGKADTSASRTGSAGPTRSARSSPTSRSWRASSSPGRCTHPTTAATCPDDSPSRVFWYTLLGMALASGWLEILGLLVAGKATGGESSDTIFSVLGGSGNIIATLAMVAIAVGTVAVNAMNDYTGSLSLQAAGIRVKRIYSAAIVAVLGFLFTLYLQSSNDFAGNFTNFLLFISYWISPFVGVILADWLLRRQRADVSRLSDFGSLPSGAVALVAIVAGFVVGIPFQNSSLGYEWGGPFNYVTANYLHGADLAYYVGGIVAFAIYWIGARRAIRAEA